MSWTVHNVQYRLGDLVFINYSGEADASDLTDAVLFDMSATVPEGAIPTKTEIEFLRVSAGGVFCRLEWDATTDDLIVAVPDGNTIEYPPIGWANDKANLINGKFTKDPGSSGTTGDILITTKGGAAGDGLSIQARIRLTWD